MEPTVIVRIAFDTDPLVAVPTWTDVSADVLSIYTKRGRQHELGRMETGIARIQLLNVDGDYWPLNTLGAYTEKVLPGKKINIQATYNSVTYDLYTGFIEAWEPAWLGEKIAITTVRCVDIGKRFSRFELNNAGEAEELSGTRVGNVLDEIGWPSNVWTSPTGFEDPDVAWTDEPDAYDENTGTFALSDVVAGESWSTDLILTVGALSCNSIRYYSTKWSATYFIDIDAYYNSAWHDVYQGGLEGAGWNEHTLGDIYSVTKLKVRLYNAAGIPNAVLKIYEFDFGLVHRHLDVGQTTVKETLAQVAVNAMTHLFLVQDSEVGILFLSPDGVVQFQDRHARLKSPYTISQATFGDDTGEQKYRFLNPSYDDQFIYNDIRRTRANGGVEQTASDATSQDDYGKSTDNKTGLLMLLDTEAKDQCDYMLVQYKDPHFRIRGLEIYPEIDPANLFPKVLSYDISTRITLRLNEASLDQDYHIEGITHHFDRRRGAWTTRWQLSDATGAKYWVLGVAGFSELSLTTTLAY